MNKVLRMHLSFFMKPMNVSELAYGLGIVLYITTPPGGLIIVLEARYFASLCLPQNFLNPDTTCFRIFDVAVLIANPIVLGNHYVSSGPSHVLTGVPCWSKSGVFDRQRIQVGVFFISVFGSYMI